ncbi:MAG: ferredoxin--NADP reductase [Candidatus Woesearchaeota archaeon]
MFRPHPIQQFESSVIAIEDVSDTVRHFTFSVPEDFAFSAGQFVTILFEKDGNKYRRQYSIFSSPSQKQSIVISVKFIENGPGSLFLWNLQKGDMVKMMAPLGVFVVRDEHKTGPLVFIGVGTGVAPFVSMIRDLLEQSYPHQITLICGHRHTILYEKILQKLANEYDQFTYIPVLSKPEQPFKHTGYVQDFLPPIDSQTHVYICGLYKMIEQVVHAVKAQGVLKTCIHFERYD